MKSAMLSIQPYYVFLIIARLMGWDIPQHKTVEVRKSYPKAADWDRKAIIYCSNNRKSFKRIPKEYQPLMRQFLGKVVGEFVCDRIEDYYCATYGKWVEEYDKDAVWVPQNQLFKIKDKDEYKAVVFERNDKYLDTGISTESLKEICLSAQELFNYVGGLGKHLYAWHISELAIYDKPKELGEFVASKPKSKFRAHGDRLTRPFQSWGYVEAYVARGQ